MTKEELIEAFENIYNRKEDEYKDEEDWHKEADNLLLKYINDEEITKAFNDIPKWYA